MVDQRSAHQVGRGRARLRAAQGAARAAGRRPPAPALRALSGRREQQAGEGVCEHLDRGEHVADPQRSRLAHRRQRRRLIGASASGTVPAERARLGAVRLQVAARQVVGDLAHDSILWPTDRRPHTFVMAKDATCHRCGRPDPAAPHRAPPSTANAADKARTYRRLEAAMQAGEQRARDGPGRSWYERFESFAADVRLRRWSRSRSGSRGRSAPTSRRSSSSCRGAAARPPCRRLRALAPAPARGRQGELHGRYPGAGGARL